MKRARGEFELIAEVFAPLATGAHLAKGASGAEAFGLGDDAAILRPPPGVELVVSTDAMVRGVHFDHRTDPGDVGRKLLRVNLSDLAAKGAEPMAYTLTAGWPADVTDDWIIRFAAGLAADQATYGVHLIGGDTVAMPADLLLSVTIFGHVPAGTMVRRAGACAGDDLYVSGTIGDARFGLMVAQGAIELEAGDAFALRGRLDRPTPRLKLGKGLRGLAHAAIDVSDGLLADLGHLCEQSRVGAEVQLSDVPLSEPARRALDRVPGERQGLLTFGDDYELLFAAAPGEVGRVQDVARTLGVRITRVGHIVKKPGVRVVDRSGAEIRYEAMGFQHF